MYVSKKEKETFQKEKWNFFPTFSFCVRVFIYDETKKKFINLITNSLYLL